MVLFLFHYSNNRKWPIDSEVDPGSINYASVKRKKGYLNWVSYAFLGLLLKSLRLYQNLSDLKKTGKPLRRPAYDLSIVVKWTN